MLSLLASVAVLVGAGTSHNYGERVPFPVATAEARLGEFAFEAGINGAEKVETGDGWQSRLGLEYHSGPVSIGAFWKHRQTSRWTKDRLFLRGGFGHGPLRLLAEVAPDSPNMEARGEVRIRLVPPALDGRLILEPRYWVGWHTMAEELGSYGWGVEMLVGIKGD